MSGWMADMTTTLTVNTVEVENKTNITCQTQLIFYLILASSILQVILSYIIISPICIELFSPL